MSLKQCLLFDMLHNKEAFDLSRSDAGIQDRVRADVKITFSGKTTWNDTLILQDSFERNRFLEIYASITNCSADDGCK